MIQKCGVRKQALVLMWRYLERRPGLGLHQNAYVSLRTQISSSLSWLDNELRRAR